jgi:hypothetical protein
MPLRLPGRKGDFELGSAELSKHTPSDSALGSLDLVNPGTAESGPLPLALHSPSLHNSPEFSGPVHVGSSLLGDAEVTGPTVIWDEGANKMLWHLQATNGALWVCEDVNEWTMALDTIDPEWEQNRLCGYEVSAVLCPYRGALYIVWHLPVSNTTKVAKILNGQFFFVDSVQHEEQWLMEMSLVAPTPYVGKYGVPNAATELEDLDTNSIQLSGSNWLRVPLPGADARVHLTPNTTLTFDYKSDDTLALAAIGFTRAPSASVDAIVAIHGSGAPLIPVPYVPGSGWRTISVSIGSILGVDGNLADHWYSSLLLVASGTSGQSGYFRRVILSDSNISRNLLLGDAIVYGGKLHCPAIDSRTGAVLDIAVDTELKVHGTGDVATAASGFATSLRYQLNMGSGYLASRDRACAAGGSPVFGPSGWSDPVFSRVSAQSIAHDPGNQWSSPLTLEQPAAGEVVVGPVPTPTFPALRQAQLAVAECRGFRFHVGLDGRLYRYDPTTKTDVVAQDLTGDLPAWHAGTATTTNPVSTPGQAFAEADSFLVSLGSWLIGSRFSVGGTVGYIRGRIGTAVYAVKDDLTQWTQAVSAGQTVDFWFGFGGPNSAANSVPSPVSIQMAVDYDILHILCVFGGPAGQTVPKSALLSYRIASNGAPTLLLATAYPTFASACTCGRFDPRTRLFYLMSQAIGTGEVHLVTVDVDGRGRIDTGIVYTATDAAGSWASDARPILLPAAVARYSLNEVQAELVSAIRTSSTTMEITFRLYSAIRRQLGIAMFYERSDGGGFLPCTQAQPNLVAEAVLASPNGDVARFIHDLSDLAGFDGTWQYKLDLLPAPPPWVVPVPTPLNPDLAWWKLDETSGDTAIDSVGSHDMPIVGAYWNRGLVCAGDGAAGYGAITGPARWREQPLTISAWVSPFIRNDPHNGGGYPVAPGDIFSNDIPGSGGLGIFAHVWESSSGVGDAIGDTRALTPYPVTGLLHYPGNTFLVTTVVGPAFDICYLNGVEIARAVHSGITDVATTFRLGYHNNDPTYGTSRFFKGRIQDVRIFGRALDPTEVMALAAAGPVNFTVGTQLTSYIWPVSRGSGSTFNCVDNPAANGTITGSVEWYSDGFRFRSSKTAVADVSSLPLAPVGEVPWWLSFCAYVADSSPATGQLLSYGAATGAQRIWLYYSYDPVVRRMAWNIPGVANGEFSDSVILDDTFHHYLVSYVPGISSATLRLWIDSVEVTPVIIPLINVLKERLRLGDDSSGVPDAVEGYLRNVRVGLGAPTQEQAERLWLADRIPSIPPVVAPTAFYSVSPSALYGYTAPLVSDQPPVGNITGGNAFPFPGFAFLHWTTADATLLQDARIPDSQFQMPNHDVHFVAVFQATTTNLLTLTSASGVILSGEGTIPNVVPGARLQVTADAPAPGFAFDHWAVTPPEIAAIIDPTTVPATFPMPSFDVTMEAIYAFITSYNVTIVDGFGSGAYSPGDTVFISQNYPYGYVFDQWTGDPGDLALLVPDVFSQYAQFTMPSRDVTLTASYIIGQYSVQVYRGSGSGVYTFGDPVYLVADPVDPGWEFAFWNSPFPPQVSFVDQYNPSTSFTMIGDGPVYVEAVWNPIVYNLTVTDGYGDFPTFTVLYGFAIYANSPPPGKIFDHWEGDVGYLDNPASAAAYVFSPPPQNLSFTAIFVDEPN